jgi:hypothetical protein
MPNVQVIKSDSRGTLTEAPLTGKKPEVLLSVLVGLTVMVPVDKSLGVDVF